MLPSPPNALFPTSPDAHVATSNLFRSQPRQGLSSRNGYPAVATGPIRFRLFDHRRDHEFLFWRTRRSASSPRNRSNALLRLRVDVSDRLHTDGSVAVRHRDRNDACDATDDTQRFLDQIMITDLHLPETWQELTVPSPVLPEADIFPVRARYGSEPIATIGLNYLSAIRRFGSPSPIASPRNC